MMHSLLKRQIKKHLGSEENIPAKFKSFIHAVNHAYRQSDDDREMLERSMELSSRELLDASAEMRAVLQAFPDLFFRVDKNGVIVFAKSGSDKNIFRRYQNFIGKRIQSIPEKHIGEKFEKALKKVTRTSEIERVEYSREIKGKHQFYEARLIPLPDKQIFIIIRNITETKHAEQELVKEKELLSITLESIGDGVITTDMEGRVVTINKSAEMLTGFSQEELKQFQIEDKLKLFDPETGESCQSAATYILKDQTIPKYESRSILRDMNGREKKIQQTASLIRDSYGVIVGSVLVLQDITEKLKLEEEILNREKIGSISLLAGGIAHDFNNALSAILGNISIAKLSTPKKDLNYKRLIRAEEASYLAKDLTQQLLTFAKGGTPIKEIMNLSDTIQEMVSFSLSGSNISCRFHISRDLWPVEIDRGQFSQVINNLTINAIQAMPGGGIIDISLKNDFSGNLQKRDPGNPEFVKISFTDQGTGIEKAKIPYIFDPFYTTKPDGNGLGLATSYSIIRSHGGRIELESEPGKGTTFFIYLPAVPEGDVPQDSEDHLNFDGSGKILIMDDDETIRLVLHELLELLGYESESSRDGKEVIAKYQAAMKAGKPYDAVIMDLTVPGGLGGQEAIADLLKIDPDIIAIVSSGYSDSKVMSNYKKFGFKGVLPKPFKVDKISRLLDNVLKSRQ